MAGVAARGVAGPLLSAAGGLILMAGALLPWLVVGYVLPGPGAMTTHKTHVQMGLQDIHGQVVLGAGVLLIVLGLVMLGVAEARRTGTLLAGVGTVVAAAALGDWLLRVADAGAHPAMPGTVVAAVGVLLSLAALPLGWPGSPRQCAALLGAAAVVSAVGTVAANALIPETSPVPLF